MDVEVSKLGCGGPAPALLIVRTMKGPHSAVGNTSASWLLPPIDGESPNLPAMARAHRLGTSCPPGSWDVEVVGAVCVPKPPARARPGHCNSYTPPHRAINHLVGDQEMPQPLSGDSQAAFTPEGSGINLEGVLGAVP